ncbi:hypothetical protein FRC00_001172, partial [Tulasnella sp. 408]
MADGSKGDLAGMILDTSKDEDQDNQDNLGQGNQGNKNNNVKGSVDDDEDQHNDKETLD